MSDKYSLFVLKKGGMTVPTETEKIQAILKNIAGEKGAVPVQTILYILGNWVYEANQQATLDGAIAEAESIACAAEAIAHDPSHWVANGRLNVTSFDHHFLDNVSSPILFTLYTDLKLVLQKLDTTFGQNFRVESALNYLRDVAKYARLLQKDFNQAKSS